jgi:hypothetical protein
MRISKGCGTTPNIFRFGGVLHARQLHHDAVQALLLDDGFSHAQFVDTVVQRGDILLERLLLHFAGGFRVSSWR